VVSYPQRVISLVPSLTEYLLDLGMAERLIGRTRFCIHPADRVDTIPHLGGTKNPKIEAIREAKPELVVLNKEENRREDVEAIAGFAPILLTDIVTLEQALEAMIDIGEAVGLQAQAGEMVARIRKAIPLKEAYEPLKAAYLIWRRPWMAAGKHTYIDDMMDHFGLINVVDEARYPVLELEKLKTLKPDLILLSSEPYPFKEKHIAELEAACPASRIMLVDGEWFSWYGSRMIPALNGLKEWRSSL
jgi:ABC-type Fe3+-hydroxamate transport system substrate-binding protein